MLRTPTPAKDSSWSAVAWFWAGLLGSSAHGIPPVPPQRHPPDAAQVVQGGVDDVHRRIGIVCPLDRRLRDPYTEPLGRDDQLGVEEPLVVADQRQDLQRTGTADGLEAALEVGDVAAQREPHNVAVRPRDQLALGPADDPGAPSEPGAHRQVTVAGQHRSDQREKRGQGGGEVHVHVGHDVGLAGRPGRAERVAAALAGQDQSLYAGEGRGQLLGDERRAVRAPVVGDGDHRAEGEGLVEILAQARDAGLECGGLVVDGDHHLDLHGVARPVGIGSRHSGAALVLPRASPPCAAVHDARRRFHPIPPKDTAGATAGAAARYARFPLSGYGSIPARAWAKRTRFRARRSHALRLL